MAQRQYFRHHYKAVGKAATQPYLEDDKSPDGCETHYQRITVLNEDTANSDVSVQINRRGDVIPTGFILDLAANEAKTYDGAEIVLQGEDVLRIQWVASADGDNLHVTLEGYLWKAA